MLKYNLHAVKCSRCTRGLGCTLTHVQPCNHSPHQDGGHIHQAGESPVSLGSHIPAPPPPWGAPHVPSAPVVGFDVYRTPRTESTVSGFFHAARTFELRPCRHCFLLLSLPLLMDVWARVHRLTCGGCWAAGNTATTQT